MADITMCEGKDCPIRQDCYRFLAVSNPFRQSYFSEVPYNKEKEKCDEYWKINNNKTKKT